MGDKTKFIAFIKLHEQKAEKTKAGNVRARAAIADHGKAAEVLAIKRYAEGILEQQLANLRSELTQTEAAVSAQNLSPDEVNRMNHERESLTRNLDDLRSKIAEASQSAYDQEMLVTKSMDRFEQLLQDYTALGHQIGVISPLGEGPSLGPGNLDYTIELDLGQEDLNEVQLDGKRMRQIIWPALQTYGETFRKQGLELANETIALEDEFDRLGSILERQKENVATREVKLRVAHEQVEDLKSVSGVYCGQARC